MFFRNYRRIIVHVNVNDGVCCFSRLCKGSVKCGEDEEEDDDAWERLARNCDGHHCENIARYGIPLYRVSTFLSVSVCACSVLSFS